MAEIRHLVIFCVFAITLALILLAALAVKDSTASDEELSPPINDTLALLAVKELHSHLDDNKDGQVDSMESTEFVRDELHQSQTKSGQKSQKFHKEDDTISLDELWNKWTANEAYNWCNSEVIEWLKNVAEIPELVPQFKTLHINGKHLPLIATNFDQFWKQLDVKGHQRKKLQLRAMDLVLFGPIPIAQHFWKDIVMTFSIILSVFGLGYAWRKHHTAGKRIDKFLKEIQVYENEVKILKERMKQNSDSSDTMDCNSESENETAKVSAAANTKSSPNKEISRENSQNEDDTPIPNVPRKRSLSRENSQNEDDTPIPNVPRKRSLSCDDQDLTLHYKTETQNLRTKIWELETQLESMTNNSLALKELLMESCRSEWYYIDTSKKLAEEEMFKAQKMCDKIKKKRSSVIGAFSLANSSTLEDAGLTITRAYNKMHRVTENFDEYNKRWKSVEHLCGFSVLSSTYSSSQFLQEVSPNNGNNSRRSSISSHRKSKKMTYDSGSSSPKGGHAMQSWNSAPSGLYKSTDSTSSDISDGKSLGGASDRDASYRFYLKESYDCLGVIEEENVAQNGRSHKTSSPQKNNSPFENSDGKKWSPISSSVSRDH